MVIDTLGLEESVQGRKTSKEGTPPQSRSLDLSREDNDCRLLGSGHICWAVGARVGP